MSLSVSSINIGSANCALNTDYQEIIKRLLALGIQPSGDKARDRALLHTKELEHAKQDAISGSINVSKYYTIDSNQLNQLVSEHQQKTKSQNAKSPEETKNFEDQTGATQIAMYKKWQIMKMKELAL